MDVQIGDEMVDPTGKYRLVILSIYDYQWTLFGGDPNHWMCRSKSHQSVSLLESAYWNPGKWKLSTESRIDRLLKKYNGA